MDFEKWYEDFSNNADNFINMSKEDIARYSFIAGQNSVLYPDNKCTTDKLCPIHNVWHAKPIHV